MCVCVWVNHQLVMASFFVHAERYPWWCLCDVAGFSVFTPDQSFCSTAVVIRDNGFSIAGAPPLQHSYVRWIKSDTRYKKNPKQYCVFLFCTFFRQHAKLCLWGPGTCAWTYLKSRNVNGEMFSELDSTINLWLDQEVKRTGSIGPGF